MIVETSTLLLFLPACFAMNLTIGPNNLMVMNNGARHGPQLAATAVLGRLVGQAILITASAAGLATLLMNSAFAFSVVKTVGALWLLWIAWGLWRAPVGSAASPSEEAQSVRPTVRVGALMRDEFMVALVNPKAILIFTAFLPQFVDATRPVAPQFVVIGTLFLLLEWVAAAGYGVLGARLALWLRTARNRQRFQRVNASLLATAAIALLAMRNEPSDVAVARH